MSDQNNVVTEAANYLGTLLTPLLAHPSDIRIDTKTDELGGLLTLEVNPADMGRVIGKGGETARSFRRLVRQFGMGRQVKVSTRIIDPKKDGGFDVDKEQSQ